MPLLSLSFFVFSFTVLFLPVVVFGVYVLLNDVNNVFIDFWDEIK